MGHLGHIGETRNAYKILSEKHVENGSIGRPAHRWEDNIKMHRKDIGCERIDSIHLAQNEVHWRVVINTVMDFWDSKKRLEFLKHMNDYQFLDFGIYSVGTVIDEGTRSYLNLQFFQLPCALLTKIHFISRTSMSHCFLRAVCLP